MAIRIGRRIPNWLILIIGTIAILLGLGLAALAKPVPEYLVATSILKPGMPLNASMFTTARVELGAVADSYLRADHLLPGTAVARVVRPGELISNRDLTTELNPDFTSLRILPKLKPASAVQAGRMVALWQALPVEDEPPQLQRLIARAEVLEVAYGEGLFAQELPEVEIRLSQEQATLVMQAISAKFDLYLIPVQ
jgi:hypothetical protein